DDDQVRGQPRLLAELVEVHPQAPEERLELSSRAGAGKAVARSELGVGEVEHDDGPLRHPRQLAGGTGSRQVCCFSGEVDELSSDRACTFELAQICASWFEGIELREKR